MIERGFINQKTKEFYIKKYVEKTLGNVGISNIILKKIPLGEKLIIYTNRPSLIVGSKGANIILILLHLILSFFPFCLIHRLSFALSLIILPMITLELLLPVLS